MFTFCLPFEQCPNAGENWREIQNFKLQNVLMVNANVKQMLRGEIAIVADKEPTACRK